MGVRRCILLGGVHGVKGEGRAGSVRKGKFCFVGGRTGREGKGRGGRMIY